MPSVSLVSLPQHPAGGWTWSQWAQQIFTKSKLPRYFEVETVIVYDPQRDGRFLAGTTWEGFGGGWGLSQPLFQGGI